MGKIFLPALILLQIFLFTPLFGQEDTGGTTKKLKAGVFKVDITPPIDIPLGGYANRTGPATGIRDSLNAVVIVFDDDVTKVVIVTLDIIQVKYNEGQQICRAIEKVSGISQDKIILNASHTHGSPWLETDSIYSNEVATKIADAVKIASENLNPVSIGYGEGAVNFNVNRRIVTEAGDCYNGLNPEGITDHRVKVLRVDDQKNIISPLALIFHTACHANVFRWQNTQVTADFPGEAKSFIERNFGNNTTAMFLQGCAGDIRANLPEKGKTPKEPSFGRNGDEADLRWCAWSTGAEVVKTATWLGMNEQYENRQVDNSINAVAGLIKVDAKPGKEALWPREHIVNGKANLPVKIITIGSFCFVGLPGEPVVEYGLKIEEALKKMGFAHVFVMGYMDGDIGYIPTKKMFGEGGYEVTECSLQPTCEDEIIEGITTLANKIITNGN